MGANQNIPKNAEKFCGSFYKDDFSEFYPESVFRSENGSKLSIFGPKYVFFVNSVPDVCQIIKILKICLLMLPMRIFCYLWNFRTTSQKKCIQQADLSNYFFTELSTNYFGADLYFRWKGDIEYLHSSIYGRNFENMENRRALSVGQIQPKNPFINFILTINTL